MRRCTLGISSRHFSYMLSIFLIQEEEENRTFAPPIMLLFLCVARPCFAPSPPLSSSPFRSPRQGDRALPEKTAETTVGLRACGRANSESLFKSKKFPAASVLLSNFRTFCEKSRTSCYTLKSRCIMICVMMDFDI